MFLSGHFYVDENLSLRDWINLEGLFECKNIIGDERFIGSIDRYISAEIKEKDCILIGVGYFGGMVASTLGYKCKKPFSYYFGKNDAMYIDESEGFISNLEYNDIYIIHDAIVDGNKINQVIEEFIITEKVDRKSKIHVVILFDRSAVENDSALLLNPYIDDIIVINDSFIAEKCKKNQEECLFRRQQGKEKIYSNYRKV